MKGPRTSNDEFVRDLMRFGNPMKQLVIMEAIRRYADECAKMDPETCTEGIWNFISPEGWKAAALEISNAFAARHADA